jgi:hypothetical protein
MAAPFARASTADTNRGHGRRTLGHVAMSRVHNTAPASMLAAIRAAASPTRSRTRPAGGRATGAIVTIYFVVGGGAGVLGAAASRSGLGLVEGSIGGLSLPPQLIARAESSTTATT